jgi:hypothetical protein
MIQNQITESKGGSLILLMNGCKPSCWVGRGREIISSATTKSIELLAKGLITGQESPINSAAGSEYVVGER